MTGDPRTAWVKARDSQLSGAGRGRVMPDEREVVAEAALVLTFPDPQDTGPPVTTTVAIHGSYQRLLKTLDYARHQLLASAPDLELVTGYPDDQDEVDFDAPLEGLKCPHCGAVTWDGDEEGVRVVDAGERWNSFGYRVVPGLDGVERKIVGGYGDAADMHGDRYECESCEKPVNLPEDVTEVGW